jgi:repressor of nif and glnA expression
MREKAGLGRVAALGWPGHSLMEIPMNAGRVGGILIGGLNPVGAVVALDIPVISRTVSNLMPYKDLFHYSYLMREFRKRF